LNPSQCRHALSKSEPGARHLPEDSAKVQEGYSQDLALLAQAACTLGTCTLNKNSSSVHSSKDVNEQLCALNNIEA